MSRCAPAAAVYIVGAGGVTGLGRVTGGRVTGVGAFFVSTGVGSTAGTSWRSAVVSLGTSVRLRAVESAAALDCSPFAQARRKAKDKAAMRTFFMCVSSLCDSHARSVGSAVTTLKGISLRFSVVLAEPILQDGDTGSREKFPCSPSRFPLQSTLQKLRRQPLQPARQQREPIGDQQQAEQDEQHARDALDPREVRPEPLEPREKTLQR